MTTSQRIERADPATHDGSLQRRFILLAGATAVLPPTLIDHVIRGELVVNRG